MAWGTQRNWRWCSKCQGMWFGGNPAGPCPGGGVHTKDGERELQPGASGHQRAGTVELALVQQVPGLVVRRQSRGSLPGRGQAHQDGQRQLHDCAPIRRRAARLALVQQVPGHVVFLEQYRGKVPGGRRPFADGKRQLSAGDRHPAHPRSHQDSDRAEHLHRHADAQHAGGLRDGGHRCGMGEHGEPEPPGAERSGCGGLRDGLDDGRAEHAVHQPEQRRRPTTSWSTSSAARCRPSMGARRTRRASPARRWCRRPRSGRSRTRWGTCWGLFHVNNNDRLMTGNGTANITNPPPDLVASEVTTMTNSALTTNV